MTVCIAALCDNRKSLVLAADKMVGMRFVEAELNIQKRLALHKDWWVMVAGEEINPVFDIVDYARQNLSGQEEVGVDSVMRHVTGSYQRKRLEIGEALHLSPRGWTIDRFHSEGRALYDEAMIREIDYDIRDSELKLTLLVAGFDAQGQGHIFSVRDPGIAIRHDVPGFHAIGSGAFGAISSMFYRALNIKMPVRHTLYYTFEAKIAGERASGVGFETDMYILRQGLKAKKISKETEKRLEGLWKQLRPRDFSRRNRQVLSRLPEIRAIKEKT